jgi:hypothetical protein
MQIEGYNFNGPNVTVVVIPRNDKNIIFKAQAILDFKEFDGMIKPPVPPMRTKPGTEEQTPNFESPDYKKAVHEYAEKKTSYIVIKSLSATPGLKWDTVSLADPDTWSNYDKELKAAFFSEVEITSILEAVWEANALDDNKIREARDRFLASEQVVVQTT